MKPKFEETTCMDGVICPVCGSTENDTERALNYNTQEHVMQCCSCGDFMYVYRSIQYTAEPVDPKRHDLSRSTIAYIEEVSGGRNTHGTA